MIESSRARKVLENIVETVIEILSIWFAVSLVAHFHHSHQPAIPWLCRINKDLYFENSKTPDKERSGFQAF